MRDRSTMYLRGSGNAPTTAPAPDTAGTPAPDTAGTQAPDDADAPPADDADAPPCDPANRPAVPPPAPARPAPPRWRGRAVDAAALVTFGFLGWYLMRHLWSDPRGLHVAANRQDTVQVQWLLLHATRLFTHGESPMFTTLINAPYGVNLMANTSILAIALPLAPVTLALGPAVTAALLFTVAPAATAAAWYHVLSRHVLRSRLAAFVGALFTGFAPAMVSHSAAHPNIVSQFVLPYIVLTVLRLRVPGRAVRTGLELAGLVVLQIFINEEVLFLTALVLGLFILAMLAFRPREITPYVRPALVAAGVTTGVAGAALAYPLWYQFFGPMAYRGLPLFVLDYGTDLASFTAYPTQSRSGPSTGIELLSNGATEQNTFFGLPLLLLLAVIVIWRWRSSPPVRALAITGVVLAALSLGSEITVRGERTGIPGPWRLLADMPLFDSVVPTRLAVFITPVVALLLALSLDHAIAGRDGSAGRVRRRGEQAVARGRRAWRAGPATLRQVVPATLRRRAVPACWVVATAAALLPIAPTPIAVAQNLPTPRFFASGTWRDYLPAGATVVPVPLGWDEAVDVMQWQLAVDCTFVTPGGYYLAPPPGQDDRRARYGAEPTPTMALLERLALYGGRRPQIGSSERARARADLRTWQVDALVMPDRTLRAETLRTTVQALVGPGRHVDDVWLWDVRSLTGS